MMRVLSLEHLPAGQCCMLAHWQYAPSGDSPELHTHEFHELFWVEEGEGVHHINGDARPLAPGSLVLVRADDVHGFSAARSGPPLRFCNFSFPVEHWAELHARRFERRAVFFANKNHLEREWRLAASDLDRLRAMARDLAAGARDSLSCEALLVGVIGLLANLENRIVPGRLPPWLTDALARIQEPARFALGTPEFARLAGRSPEHLARELRRLTGLTPTDVINDARLAHAARQLTTTQRPVADIALECGLRNLGHFYKLFRARFDTSPERYRQHAYLPRGGVGGVAK